MNAAVFLDRDNTIIHNDGDLGDPDQVELIQGSAMAIASLCGLGYKVVVITNQGGVARGKYGEEDVDRVHQRVRELVEAGANGARIDAFYYCPFHPNGTVKKYKKEHPDRKPNPGMLLRAAEDLKLDLGQSWMVGDQVRDCQAGQAAGTRTILIREDAEQLEPLNTEDLPAGASDDDRGENGQARQRSPHFYAKNVVEAVRIIAQQRKPDAVDEMNRKGPKKWDVAAIAKLQRQRKQAAAGEEGDAGGKAAADRPEPVRTSATATAPKSPRPFRPWNAPTPREDGAKPPGTAGGAAKPKPQPPAEEAKPFSGAGPAQPAEQPSAPSRPADPEMHEAIAPAPPAPKPAPPKQTPAKAAPPAPTPTPAPPPVAADAEADPDAEQPETAPATREPSVHLADTTAMQRTLKQILQELRAQRGHVREFNYLTVIAIFLQLTAIVCLAGGLMMGAADEGLFLRWLLSGLLVQLAAIAILLFHR